MSKTPARSTLTPEAWIVAATDVLIDRGIDAVRVDVLAKAMDVTRGSFYWHFKDREALLVAVLNAWRDAATEQVIDRFEGQQADPAALIGELQAHRSLRRRVDVDEEGFQRAHRRAPAKGSLHATARRAACR